MTSEERTAQFEAAHAVANRLKTLMNDAHGVALQFKKGTKKADFAGREQMITIMIDLLDLSREIDNDTIVNRLRRHGVEPIIHTTEDDEDAS